MVLHNHLGFLCICHLKCIVEIDWKLLVREMLAHLCIAGCIEPELDSALKLWHVVQSL
jgi:hypothetical protein